jgi:hypothetical protein
MESLAETVISKLLSEAVVLKVWSMHMHHLGACKNTLTPEL